MEISDGSQSTATSTERVPAPPQTLPPDNPDRLSYDRRAVSGGGPEEALALYRAIFSNSADAIAIIDPTGRYLEQNDAHRTLIGYTTEELRGNTPAIHLGEDVFRSVAEELAARGRCRREATSRAKDGRAIDIELSAFVVRDRAGEPVCFVGVKRDVTERNRSAAERERRLQQLEAVYRLAEAVGRAEALEEIYQEALTGLQRAVGADRASILLFDPDGTMRFKAWSGLSDEYRAAVEGHTPWSSDTVDPQPILIADAAAEPSLAALYPVIAAEGIRGMGFIPLVFEGRLLGKFMIYFDTPHPVTAEEMRLARAIASHIAFAIVRTRSETELRESEERYRHLMEVCPLGVAVLSEDRIVFANPACARLLRTERAGMLLGRSLLDFVHADHRSTLLERVRMFNGTTDVPAVEERLVRVDGSSIDIEMSVTGFAFQGRPAAQVVLRDVTDRNRRDRAQRLLAETGALLNSSLDYEDTLQTIAQLAVPVLADWCFVDLFEPGGAFQRLAVAHADPADAPLARALRRHHDPRPDATYGAAKVAHSGCAEIASDPPAGMFAALARDDDHRRMLDELGIRSYMCVPLTARGSTVGAVTFLTTTSARRYDAADLELAEELGRRAALAVDNARLYHEAREANLAKSQFLATMSHELRTPLNAIAGYAELLEMGLRGPVSDAQREDLRRIRVNQRHLLGLINDVFNFAKLESGHVELSITDVAVEETLAETGALIEPKMAARGLQYDYRRGEPSVYCRADGEKLRQVVLNLLSNAVKFTERGGRVMLEWETCDDEVRIHVRDTGRGIPAEKLEAIFEPFVQLQHGLNGRADGTGLGLAISRELARAMKGDVTVASSPGEGSTFTLALPRWSSDERPAITRQKRR